MERSMKKDQYLPIGSIVRIKGSEKKLMIFGRRQKEKDKERLWDYVACLYPEGNLSMEVSILFQQEQIEEIYFLGYSDDEEAEYRSKFLDIETEAGKPQNYM